MRKRVYHDKKNPDSCDCKACTRNSLWKLNRLNAPRWIFAAKEGFCGSTREEFLETGKDCKIEKLQHVYYVPKEQQVYCEKHEKLLHIPAE